MEIVLFIVMICFVIGGFIAIGGMFIGGIIDFIHWLKGK